MLRVGVIGCGGMGRDHIKRITERTQGAEVVAVSDVFEEGAKKAAEIAGGAKVYTDGKALINDPDVDAVLYDGRGLQEGNGRGGSLRQTFDPAGIHAPLPQGI